MNRTNGRTNGTARRGEVEFTALPKAMEASIDVERAFLGSLLLRQGRDRRAIDDALTIADAHHFGGDRCRAAFEFFRRTHNAGREVGTEFLAPAIAEAEGEVWDATGDYASEVVEWLIGVMELPSNVTTPQEYALAVVDRWRHREVIYAMRDADRSMASPLADTDEVIELLRKKLDDITAAADVEDDSQARIGAVLEKPPGEDVPPISTGLGSLDKALRGGIRQKQLIVIGARPAIGKSALLGQIGGEIGKAEIPILYLTCEMAVEEMRDRWNRQEQWENFEAFEYKMLTNRPLWIRESGGWTIERIEAEVRRAVSKHGIRVVALDYLNLVQTAQRFHSPVERIGEITRRLKQLAMQQNVCVLTAAQFNRGAESRPESDRPRMSDFRESGSIEQDADILLGLQRDTTPGATCEAAIYVMKQRGGETADLKQIEFERDRVRFREAIEGVANDFA